MVGFLPVVGLPEALILLALVLIIFGPGRLPQVARSLGDGIRQFRSASRDDADSRAGGD